MAIVQVLSPIASDREPETDLAGAARSSGRRRAQHTADRGAASDVSGGDDRCSGITEQPGSVCGRSPVNRVFVAERSWFERRPERWGLVTAVWKLGVALRKHRYDLGIDVRGDVLSVLVLALAGVRRRLGWSMGGGAFLLTDVAPWIPGRHEVRSRLALLERLGINRRRARSRGRGRPR